MAIAPDAPRGPNKGKLNDIQRILLSSAAQRDSDSLLPYANSLIAGERLAKAIAALVKLAMVKERETNDVAIASRADGDLRYGLFITAAGLEAIDAGPTADEMIRPAAPNMPRASKSAAVIALLNRGDGATMAELIAATDWLPHTTRAALTGLRHKGHVIERSKRGAATCYRIMAA